MHHTGILIGPDKTLRDPGRFAAAADPEHDFLRGMQALGDAAFDAAPRHDGRGRRVRHRLCQPGHAVFDLCMRLRASGRQVLYQPLAVAVWSADGAADPAPVPT